MHLKITVMNEKMKQKKQQKATRTLFRWTNTNDISDFLTQVTKHWFQAEITFIQVGSKHNTTITYKINKKFAKYGL